MTQSAHLTSGTPYSTRIVWILSLLSRIAFSTSGLISGRPLGVAIAMSNSRGIVSSIRFTGWITSGAFL